MNAKLKTKINRLAFERSRQTYTVERARLTEWAKKRTERGEELTEVVARLDAMLREVKLAQINV